MGMRPPKSLKLPEVTVNIPRFTFEMPDEMVRAISAVRQIGETLAGQFVPALQGLAKSYQQMVRCITFPAKFYEVVRNLPDLGKLAQELLKQNEILDAILEEFERLGFPKESTETLWTDWEILKLARVDAQVQSAVVTNSLLKLTRTEEFATAMLSELGNSPKLQRRSAIFEQALEAHLNRKYLVSIPTLLPQVEGIWEDALVMRNEVTYKYKDGKYGRKRKNLHLRNESARYVGTLDLKLRRTTLRDHPALRGSVQLLSDAIVPKRDEILHGRLVGYGKAKLSVQLLLVLYVLLREVRVFESAMLARA